MSKKARGPKHSKTSMPPDDHHLSQADKQVVGDMHRADAREKYKVDTAAKKAATAAEQASLERDRVEELARQDSLAEDEFKRCLDAAKQAREKAEQEATPDEAQSTFWDWFKKLWR